MICVFGRKSEPVVTLSLKKRAGQNSQPDWCDLADLGTGLLWVRLSAARPALITHHAIRALLLVRAGGLLALLTSRA